MLTTAVAASAGVSGVERRRSIAAKGRACCSAPCFERHPRIVDVVDDNGCAFVSKITTWRRSLLLANVGVSGRCFHLAFSYRNRSKGLSPELSLIFCAIGLTGVQ